MSGAWPVMLTPFRTDAERSIDWAALDRLVAWYLKANVSGLFACCLSSESYHLSEAEQLELARRIVDQVAGRVPVAVGMMGQPAGPDRVRAIRARHELGAAAVVLNVAEWVASDESEDLLAERLEALTAQLPGVDLGLYECPAPYHRLLSPQGLARIARTGRFTFFKETSCDLDSIAAKVQATRGTRLRVLNANAELITGSLAVGAAGYSGIEANYCPALCVWLCDHANVDPRAERAQQMLTQLHHDTMHRKYPTCAKAYIAMDGLPMSRVCRSQDHTLDGADLSRLTWYKKNLTRMTEELAAQANVSTPPPLGAGLPSDGSALVCGVRPSSALRREE